MYYYAKKDGTEFGLSYEQLRDRIGDPKLSPETKEIGEWISYVGKNAPETKWYETVCEVYPVNGEMTWKVERLPDDDYARAEEQWRKDLPDGIRRDRDRFLQLTVDKLNALRWAQLSEIQKKEAQEYRQALLDVPQQSGFPENVQWPEMPKFFQPINKRSLRE